MSGAPQDEVLYNFLILRSPAKFIWAGVSKDEEIE